MGSSGRKPTPALVIRCNLTPATTDIRLRRVRVDRAQRRLVLVTTALKKPTKGSMLHLLRFVLSRK